MIYSEKSKVEEPHFTANDDFRFRVQVQGFGIRFRVQGLGFRVQGVGCRVQGVGFRVQGLGTHPLPSVLSRRSEWVLATAEIRCLKYSSIASRSWFKLGVQFRCLVQKCRYMTETHSLKYSSIASRSWFRLGVWFRSLVQVFSLEVQVYERNAVQKFRYMKGHFHHVPKLLSYT